MKDNLLAFCRASNSGKRCARQAVAENRGEQFWFFVMRDRAQDAASARAARRAAPLRGQPLHLAILVFGHHMTPGVRAAILELDEGVNELQERVFPSSKRRGGCAIKKMLRSLLMKAQTGWSVPDNVTTSTFTIMTTRLRRFGGFASFSYWRSHPSCSRRGTPCPGNSFTPS